MSLFYVVTPVMAFRKDDTFEKAYIATMCVYGAHGACLPSRSP